MNTSIESQISLTGSEQRLFETPATSFTYEEARFSCAALVNRISAERQYFEKASEYAVTGWWRRGTLRRFDKRMQAVQRFAERLPIEPIEWDDMTMCYEINAENEGI